LRTHIRQLTATAVALAIVVLIACDIAISSFRIWWDAHSLTSDFVASLLVVAVTGLIFDEIVARRQRRDRATSVAVQVLIVFDQARRAYDAIIAGTAEGPDSAGASEELRTLSSMLLSAPSNLFDDPAARAFVAEVERFSGLVFQAIAPAAGGDQRPGNVDRLVLGMSTLRATAEPLLNRLPTEVLAAFEQGPRA
jgi:pilus assembly protein TadC